MCKKKILVTGSKGLAGSAIQSRVAAEWHKKPYQFIFVGREKCDLTSEQSVRNLFEREKPHYVIHCAARVGGVGGNLASPADYFYDNILMNSFMLNFAQKFNVEKLIAFSSVCVFPPTTTLQEDRMHDGPPWKDNFAYAHAKRMVDIQIEALKKQYNINNYTSVIPGNIFGTCFDENTEVITLDGIKNIKDITLVDKVYTLNPISHELEISNVVAIHKTTTNKWMCFNSKNVDFKITPDHKIYSKTNTKFNSKPASWFEKHIGKEYGQLTLAHHSISKNNSEQYPEVFSLKNYIDSNHIIYDPYVRDYKHSWSKKFPIYYHPADFVEFLGWYISEGSFTKIRENQYQIRISQSLVKNYDNYLQIENLLQRMNIPFGKDIHGFFFTSRLFINYIKDQIGNDTFNVKIPKFIFEENFPNILRQKLFNSLMKGDGDKDGKRYSTTSKLLKNQILHLSFLLGYKAKVATPEFRSNSNGPIYRICFRKIKKNISVKYKNISKITTSNEPCYCITTDKNNIIYAGRNGKFNWIHQCDMYNLEHSHLVPALIHKLYRAKHLGQEFVVWGDGQSLREFIYAEDLATVCLQLLEMPTLPPRIIVSGEREYSIREIVEMLVDVSGYRGTVKWDTTKPNGQRSRPTDKTVFNSYFPDFDYTPIRTGLHKSWQWFEQNYPNIRM